LAGFVNVTQGDVRLVPPRREGDCTCVFCRTARGRHLVLRAAVVSLVTAALLLGTETVWQGFLRDKLTGGTQVVGALLIATTLSGVLALAAWYPPARRLVHRMRPRTTLWPPPLRL